MRPVFIRLLLPIALGAVMAGCASGILVMADFERDPGIMAGEPVYLGDVQVGEVHGVDRVGSGTQVGLMLDPDRVKELKTGAAAMVSERDGRRVVYLYNSVSGEPIKPRTVLTALESPLDLALWRAGGLLEDMQQSMGAGAADWEAYFEGQEWQELKRELAQELEDLEAASAAAVARMEQDLRRLMDELERKAQTAGESAKRQYAELSERLAAYLRTLKEEGKHGADQLSELLEDIAKALEESGERER